MFYLNPVIIRVAKFACPRVLDAQKLSEDNQNLRSGCPPDYQIFLGKYFENSCPYKFFEVFILTLSFSNKHISFWELKTNRILYGIKMRATKNMSRTTRFSILVVLRLPTFDSNFATLIIITFLLLWRYGITDRHTQNYYTELQIRTSQKVEVGKAFPTLILEP